MSEEFIYNSDIPTLTVDSTRGEIEPITPEHFQTLKTRAGLFEESPFTPEKVAELMDKADRKQSIVSPKRPFHIHPDPEVLMLNQGSCVRVLFVRFVGEPKSAMRHVFAVDLENNAPDPLYYQVMPGCFHLFAIQQGSMSIYTTQGNLEMTQFESFEDSFEPSES
jgi:hypothetical protein